MCVCYQHHSNVAIGKLCWEIATIVLVIYFFEPIAFCRVDFFLENHSSTNKGVPHPKGKVGKILPDKVLFCVLMRERFTIVKYKIK